MDYNELIEWLLDGDPSIVYQTNKDLLDASGSDLAVMRKAISKSGWGKTLLDLQLDNGHWGDRFYYPKWTSSHYTLQELKNLCIEPNRQIMRTINIILNENKAVDGGINPHTELPNSDVCINGMFLDYACYFGVEEEKLESIVDFMLDMVMPDGAFNCRLNRSGAKHSSLHTTISSLEGIQTYKEMGYTYRLDELLKVAESSRSFILMHRFFKSDKTGEIIHKDMTRLSYPGRWKYDILRALDHFRKSEAAYDERMEDAFDVLLKKRRKDGTWPMQAKHPGRAHFEMEKGGRSSRWNTLRALRVLKYYDKL